MEVALEEGAEVLWVLSCDVEVELATALALLEELEDDEPPGQRVTVIEESEEQACEAKSLQG